MRTLRRTIGVLCACALVAASEGQGRTERRPGRRAQASERTTPREVEQRINTVRVGLAAAAMGVAAAW